MIATSDSAETSRPLPVRLPAGTVLGRYVVDGWVRDGGMAALFRGHHVKTGAKVAIKLQVLGGEDDETAAARFDREGEVMGRLSGVANVVQVQDVDALPDGRRYLVMEWVQGDNLEELLDTVRNEDSRLSIERACRLVKDVALALEAAHRADVVHRDVKPANIMVDRSLADREIAKLLDFGISADLGAGGQDGELTATGMSLGTSGYVAPEQAIGLPADPGFDLYSLGVVLFEAVTGFPMPPGGLAPERLPPASELRQGVPVEITALVESCLCRDPTQRPASAADVARRLDAVIDSLAASTSVSSASIATTPRPGPRPIASPPSPEAATSRANLDRRMGEHGPARNSGRNHRRTWAVVALLGVLTAVLGWWLLGRPTQASKEVHSVRGTDASVETVMPEHVEQPAVAATTGSTGAMEPATEDTGVSASTGHEDPGGTTSHGDTAEARPVGKQVRCQHAREDAQAALGGRNWAGVLRATSDASCWPTPDERVDRKVVRVQALLELGRFTACVREGSGQTDPRVARVTKFCREEAEKEAG